MDCAKKSFKGGVFYCPVCHLANGNGKNCLNCKAASRLESVVAFFDYKESGAVSSLIKNFKYNFATDIHNLWENIFENFLSEIRSKSDWPIADITIIPVPLHSSRYRERGFNQADLLARAFFESLKKYQGEIDFDNTGLRRTRATKQQARLNRQERLENLKDAFLCEFKTPPKNVILVDDVFTSGATMRECARALEAAGVEKVFGLVMARD